MPAKNQIVLSLYHYDALDRLVSCSPAASDSIQRFYQKSLLTTEIQGQIQRSIVQSEDRLLAQQIRRADLTECALVGTDQQRSVLNTAEHFQVAYTPYGTRHPVLDLPGFNGEQPDPVTGHYLLGNGYRAFNPVLIRFNSPDCFSPFGEGGLNAYAYCEGDPVNRVDPTGHMVARVLVNFFKMSKASRTAFTASSKTKYPISRANDWAFERAQRRAGGPGPSPTFLSPVDESWVPPLPPRPGTITLPVSLAQTQPTYDYVAKAVASKFPLPKFETRPTVWKPVMGDAPLIPKMPNIFESLYSPNSRRVQFSETMQEGERIASVLRAARRVRATTRRP